MNRREFLAAGTVAAAAPAVDGSSVMQAAQRGDSAAVVRDFRVRSLMWPYYFIKVVLGYQDLDPNFHGKELERFIGALENGATKQAIEFPRGNFKTTCYTIGCGIWFLLPCTEADTRYALDVLKIPKDTWEKRTALHNQNYSQLLAFESADNGSVKLGEIERHFERNELFRTCFAEIAYQKTADESPWNTRAMRIRRTGNGYLIGEATFEVMGVDAALQSRHYDIIWEDDIVGKAATEQPTVMATTIRWHGLLAGVTGGPTLKNNTWRFLVSNRWGYSDLNSHIQRTDPDFVFHTRSVMEFNETTGKDEWIFPDRMKRWKTLDEHRRYTGLTRYDYACQFMNRPFLQGDQEVDVSKLHLYTVEENGEIVCSCGYRTFASHMMRYGHYDPYNAKGKRSTSAPAIAIVGLAADQAQHKFLLDYFVAKGDYAKIFAQIISFNDLWWPDAWTYEDVGNQNMAEFYLREVQKSEEFKKWRGDKGQQHKMIRRILPSKTGGREKNLRIRDSFLPIIENKVFACRSTQSVFMNMLETFPAEVHDHDYDLLDCLAQGPAVWRHPASEMDRKQEQLTEEQLLASLGQSYGYMANRIN